MRLSHLFVPVALLALGSVACAAPTEEDSGTGADAVVGLPSEENGAAQAWKDYAAKAIAHGEKAYGLAPRDNIVPVAIGQVPLPVLDRYSDDLVELKAFLMKEGDAFTYALLQVEFIRTTPHVVSAGKQDPQATRLVFVVRTGPYAGREVGTCIATSGKPLSFCKPSP
jgi:hypothetical protein